ncbi:MAG: HD-GYP domain-containing protein [Deltaproteobacteria bacterium]|nr:HD-GYP domain-containing protein [Deltaproteobacteria bacterium]
MYINLPTSWMSHSFIKNKFLITSRSQIDKIIQSSLKEIKIDTSLGKDLIDEVIADEPSPSVPETVQKVVPEGLREMIRDPKLASDKKAQAVQHYSQDMMKNLLESPTAENIGAVMTTVSEIVDLIVTDDDTNHYLLNITSHDFATYTHSVNVGILSISLAKALYRKSDNHDMHALGSGFFLHDLGKTRIDQSIINKPGKLTEQEWNEMRGHPNHGFEILTETDKLNKESRIIVLQHHERNDGSGYPLGIKGDDIHPYGRICSVADVYDALTSIRPYKPKIPPFEALRIMQKEMLHHFHRDVFERFVLLLAAAEKT